MSLKTALEIAATANAPSPPSKTGDVETEPQKIPVLLFSGFMNDEMMSAYNIIGPEIYEETGGVSNPACAKAVPNAMEKPLFQVIEEISGDHADAMGITL